jgi:hypothetical protein
MSEKKLSGSLALTKLIHVRMTCKGKNGEVEGLFIPIKANYLIEGAPAEDKSIPVYMPIGAVIRDEQDKYGQNGFISKQLDSKDYKKMTDEEKAESKKFTPILGNVKDWTSGGSSNADTGGAATSGTVDENDDLPF